MRQRARVVMPTAFAEQASGLSPAAFRLHVTAWLDSGAHLLDGRLSPHRVKFVCARAGASRTSRSPTR